MKFEIKKLSQISGKRVTVYSIIPEGEPHTLFERFIHENLAAFPEPLEDIKNRIRVIAEVTGIRDDFFEKPEGKLGQDIVALFDKKRKLRLYCMQIGHVVLILGGGGPKTTRTLQEDPKLKSENAWIRKVCDALDRRIRDGEIRLVGMELTGDLIFDDDPMKVD